MATDTKNKYIEAVGRRKTAIARVRITPGSKTSYVVNGKALEAYFPIAAHQKFVHKPFETLKEEKPGHFAVEAKIVGGGVTAQAEALEHGISRALVKYNELYRKPLKVEGLLTRDPRVKERKKFGLRKARRAPQWSKR